MLHTFTGITSSGIVDKISSVTRKVMRSKLAHAFLFIFQLENILRPNLNFSTSYGRSIGFKTLFGLLLVLYGLEKKGLETVLFKRCPMSERCRHRLCPNWITRNFFEPKKSLSNMTKEKPKNRKFEYDFEIQSLICK